MHFNLAITKLGTLFKNLSNFVPPAWKLQNRIAIPLNELHHHRYKRRDILGCVSYSFGTRKSSPDTFGSSQVKYSKNVWLDIKIWWSKHLQCTQTWWERVLGLKQWVTVRHLYPSVASAVAALHYSLDSLISQHVSLLFSQNNSGLITNCSLDTFQDFLIIEHMKPCMRIYWKYYHFFTKSCHCQIY